MKQKIIDYFFDKEEWIEYKPYVKFLGKAILISLSVSIALQVIA